MKNRVLWGLEIQNRNKKYRIGCELVNKGSNVSQTLQEYTGVEI